MGGSGMNRPTTLPGQIGGGNRPTTLPGQIGGGGPGGGLGGVGAGGGNRPGIGGGNRPTTLPGQIGTGGGGGLGGGGGGGNRPGIGGGNRPTTLPGQIGGGGPNGNRPGIGGDRPGIGGNRPGIGGDRPGIGGDRPGMGGNWPNRPGDRPGDRPGRPGIGGNRPGIGNGLGNNVGNGIGNGIGNNIGNTIGGNNNFNNINVNGGGYGGGYGGGWGYPGGGYGGGYGGDWGYDGGYGYGGYGGGWANNWNNGYVNPHYGGWYSGCWNGNWGGGYGGGWWAPLAFGAATWGLASTIGGWGLGYDTLGYGGGAYVNPYYASIPSTVVASSPYDYSQPVVVNNYITNDGDLSNATDAQGGVGGTAAGGAATAAPVNNEANAAVDDGLAKFKAGDYAGALAGFDRAVKASPKDSVIHEVRALTLFALGRYPEAAATLNSVLVSAPGMDWTTISNVYGSVDAYTAHLRKLEDFCRANPDSASGHFVLAYHYLVGGHADMAAEALKVVVAKQPGDLVAKRLLEAITPPEEPKAEAEQPAAVASQPTTGTDVATPAGPETDLVGTWKAASDKDTVVLTITEDSKFTWKATPAGRPPVELSGTVETARDAIALNTEKAGSMVGKVQSKGADAFEFTLAGAPKEAKPLEFQRQK